MFVLVVDPSETIRRRLRELLGEAGAVDVVEAGDPARALELVKSARIHVVLLDIALGLRAPTGAGLDLLIELRRRAPAAKLIVLTNHSSDAHRRACCAHGADHFFDKSREFESAARLALQLAAGFGSTSHRRG